MTHAISWFEIPATDFDRAVEFYATVLDREMNTTELEQGPYAMLHTDEGEIGGAIAEAGEYTMNDSEASFSAAPSDSGTTIYLTVEDVDTALSEVEPAGGDVTVPKEQLEDGGYYGVIKDTEGNRVGLMSRQ